MRIYKALFGSMEGMREILTDGRGKERRGKEIFWVNGALLLCNIGHFRFYIL